MSFPSGVGRTLNGLTVIDGVWQVPREAVAGADAAGNPIHGFALYLPGGDFGPIRAVVNAIDDVDAAGRLAHGGPATALCMPGVPTPIGPMKDGEFITLLDLAPIGFNISGTSGIVGSSTIHKLSDHGTAVGAVYSKDVSQDDILGITPNSNGHMQLNWSVDDKISEVLIMYATAKSSVRTSDALTADSPAEAEVLVLARKAGT